MRETVLFSGLKSDVTDLAGPQHSLGVDRAAEVIAGALNTGTAGGSRKGGVQPLLGECAAVMRTRVSPHAETQDPRTLAGHSSDEIDGFQQSHRIAQVVAAF